MNNQELKHYGVKGMKWGVRRMTYKRLGGDALKKSREKVMGDNVKLRQKADKWKEKSAAKQLKGARRSRAMFIGHVPVIGRATKFVGSMNQVGAAKLAVKARKAEKLIRRNEKLMKLYDARISELEKLK